jgi:sec-independent protein translocase protein TatB
MFDIGFTELVLIAVVGLLVIGPERLPGTVRTGAQWLRRLKRGFNDIKREVEQELHNDAVMQDLRKTGEQLRQQTDAIGKDIRQTADSLTRPALDEHADGPPEAGPPAPGQAAAPPPTPQQDR